VDETVGFIDKITLIPEPSALLLCTVGLGALAIVGRRRKTRGLLVAFVLAVASQPAHAVTISAVPDSGTFRPGEALEVDVFLNLGEQNFASFVGGRFDFVGLGTVADAQLAGPPTVCPLPAHVGACPLWPDFSVSFPNVVQGTQQLLTVDVDFLEPGSFEIILEGAFAQLDLNESPFILDILVGRLGMPIASFTVIPESSTVLLAAIGLALLAAGRRRGR
jgi:hypothetical protein